MTRTPLNHSERGRLGATRRWGERRVVRLDRLDPATASVIRAILRAQDNAAARTTPANEAAA